MKCWAHYCVQMSYTTHHSLVLIILIHDAQMSIIVQLLYLGGFCS